MIDDKRFTTINTDAGVKPNSSAFAYWIRSEHVVIRGAQPFKRHINDSNKAELAAIVSALLIVAKDEYLRSADVIVVNCDNKNALSALRNNKLYGWAGFVLEHYEKCRKLIKAPIYFKHVKGHHNNGKPRNYINAWCDNELKNYY